MYMRNYIKNYFIVNSSHFASRSLKLLPFIHKITKSDTKVTRIGIKLCKLQPENNRITDYPYLTQKNSHSI